MDPIVQKRRAMHYMLATALVEVRGSKSLNAAQKFADVFHNLPMALLKCHTVEDFDEQYERLLERAKRHGLETYLRELIALAERATSSQ